ncbi:MAG TPA: winged helix-turn-helix domain-containing protein [Caulobacteraceae bacterium]|nr:winged helix-turn-helix domain-containing protein [Caulobacteraceae bacterium]
MAPDAHQRPFAFGDWQVDPLRGLLTGDDGESVRLEPRLMDLLLLFAGSGGRVLGKNEITSVTWGDRAIGDGTLAAAVSRLRRALGATRERRYIETVPKRGYRAVVASPPSAPATFDGPPEAAARGAQGRLALASPGPASLAQARVCFEAAMAKAPGWSPGHQGLAHTLIARHFVEQGGDLATAKAAARAAVGLDQTSAGAWATLGTVLLLADRDFAAAETALLRAIALDPTLAVAHRCWGMALSAVGRLAEAERAVRRAITLEPSALDARGDLLEILLAARRYRHAAAEAAATLSLAPELGDAWYQRGWALALAGDENEGVDCVLKGLELRGVAPEPLSALRTVFEAAGFAGACGALADLFAEQPVVFMRRAMHIAILRALAGQLDQAFATLEAAATRGDPSLMFLPWQPSFDSLKADPRYAPLTKRARLVA